MTWPIQTATCMSIIIGPGLIGSPAFAQHINPPASAMACIDMVDRVARLACFDAAYNTPIASSEEQKSGDDQSPPLKAGPLRHLAQRLEQFRHGDEAGWIVRLRSWDEETLWTEEEFGSRLPGATVPAAPSGPDTAPADVFMTMREIDADAAVENGKSAGEKAVLMLSCENNITTLGVLLPRPINTLQANLSLSGDRGSVARLNWRDVENGDVIIAGRGLESINTIRTIAGYGRIQLQVTYPDAVRAFVFDTADLSSRLKPLTTACHW